MVNTPERNPYGAVSIGDGGTPRVITVKARVNISGGYWVAGSSSLAGVGSNATSFVSDDIEGYCAPNIVNENCLGVALADTASGNYCPVAMRGFFIMPCASGTSVIPVTAGHLIGAGSGGTVVQIGSTATAGGQDVVAEPGLFHVGRALTTGSGNNSANTNDFVVVSLNL